MGGEKHCPIIRFLVASRAESALAFLSQFETINNIKPYFVKHKFVLNVYFPDDCIIWFPNMQKLSVTQRFEYQMFIST